MFSNNNVKDASTHIVWILCLHHVPVLIGVITLYILAHHIDSYYTFLQFFLIALTYH